jgi:hypothetical protein
MVYIETKVCLAVVGIVVIAVIGAIGWAHVSPAMSTVDFVWCIAVAVAPSGKWGIRVTGGFIAFSVVGIVAWYIQSIFWS